jgi:hypothetical protein
MQGWVATWLIIALALVTTAVLVYRAARRWWDYLLIVLLAAALLLPLYGMVTGDVSRYLPSAIWSDDADGKDQIILVSIAATFLLPLTVAALMLTAARAIWRAAKAARDQPR